MLGHNIGVWEKGEPAISYILEVWARDEWYLGHLPTMGAGGIALALG